jgi:hypothetical protein
LNPVVASVTANRKYDIRNTIVVAGWARSGTTWLAEVLSAIPKSAILFEPMHSERVPEAVAAGLPGTEILSPGGGTASQRLFMERVLRGDVLNWWTCSCNPVRRAIRPSVWIVKEVRANYLLDWILGTFPVRRAALIVRHPCATVASRIAQGWTPKDADRKVKQGAARRKYPQFDALCRTLTDPFEVMAARWCLMNYVPLMLQPRRFHVIAYESLATRGASDLEPLFADWGMTMPGAIEASLGRASATTKAGARQSGPRRSSIEQWKKTLTADQAARILKVVHRFGMDFYTEDPEPDYARLYRPLENA